MKGYRTKDDGEEFSSFFELPDRSGMESYIAVTICMIRIGLSCTASDATN
jgi:hypothetical protein